MWVRPRGDQVLVAQLNLVMARQVTVVLCTNRKGQTGNACLTKVTNCETKHYTNIVSVLVFGGCLCRLKEVKEKNARLMRIRLK